MKAKLLVVEGWVPDYALEFAAREFKEGDYTRLFSTGCPLTKGSYLTEIKTYADLGCASLRAMGVDSNAVVAVPAPETQMDRTYQSALALRKWFEENGQPLEAINVVTIGPHARRSRLIYRRAFGGKVDVGVFSVPPREYEPKRWWNYSVGLRSVLGESVGYARATVFSPQ